MKAQNLTYIVLNILYTHAALLNSKPKYYMPTLKTTERLLCYIQAWKAAYIHNTKQLQMLGHLHKHN